MRCLRTIVSGVTAIGCWALLSASVRAEDSETATVIPHFFPSPGYVCPQDWVVPGFIPAEATFKPAPEFPREDLNNDSEGWVVLEYTSTKGGAVRDIVVLDSVGAKSIADSAIGALATWRLSPATHHGLKVDQYDKKLRVIYRFEGSNGDEREAVHDEVIRRYNQGRSLMVARNYAEAIKSFESALIERYNLFEYSTVSFAMALAYSNLHDDPHTLFYLRHATMGAGTFLEPKFVQPAYELLMEAELHNGDIQNAACAYVDLKALRPDAVAPGSKAHSLSEKILGALNGPDPLVMDAQTSTVFGSEQQAGWRHPLFRSKFHFAAIKGEVKSFHLACRWTILDAQVNAQTEWTVPPQAGPCTLVVSGAPGATFRLFEAW